MRDTEKNAPELRFSGFNDAWEQRKLGSLATIVRGASPRPIQNPKWFDNESDIGWLRIADVTEQNGRIYHLEQHLSKLGQEKTRVLIEPHLLLSIAATVGKPVVNYVKTGVHDGFLIFLSPTFEREFMFQWLEMFRPKWQKYGQPGSQVNLNSELVQNQKIGLPNYKEQEKIGAFFQQIDQTIALHQQKLAQLELIKKGFLQQLFPEIGEKVPKVRFANCDDEWEQRKLGEVADRFDNLRIPITATKRIGGNIPYYGANGIQDYVEGFTHNGEFILIAEDGASDLQNYPVQYVNGKIWVNNHAHVLQAKCNVADNRFLMNAIQNFNIEPFLVGGGRAKLNSEVMMKIEINVPCYKEQLKVGNLFRQLDNFITLHQQKIEKLKSIKKALLQKMFI